jgi:pimeloyl-ACP methyl ester carboxylesterase
MFPRYKNIKTPVLVIGGEIDYLFPPKDVLATARALSARAVIIKDGAHDLMLQEEWVEAASKILAFFDDKIDSD